mgnify:CR=1 FL=1
MTIGAKTTEFGLLLAVIIGMFTLIGIGKLEADMTTLGAMLAAVLGYGLQRGLLKKNIETKSNGNGS